MIEFQCSTCGSRSLRAEYDMIHTGLWAIWCLNNHPVMGHAGLVITVLVQQGTQKANTT